MSIPHLGWCLNSSAREGFREIAQLLQVELPLEPVLAKMEYDGIRIDQPYLKELSKQLEQYLGAIEQLTQSWEKFNLGSPKQLSELLFDKLNLDRKNLVKSKPVTLPTRQRWKSCRRSPGS